MVSYAGNINHYYLLLWVAILGVLARRKKKGEGGLVIKKSA